MNVLLIHEDNHGVIGAAIDVDKVVSFLKRDGWLCETTEVYHNNGSKWVWEPIYKAYSEDWEDFLRSLTIEQFNEVWEGCFYLEEEKVFGTP